MRQRMEMERRSSAGMEVLPSRLREALAIGTASVVYPPLLNWAETGKTLSQSLRDDPRHRSFLSSSRAVLRAHGWGRLLLTGLETSLAREICYNTSRWALYGMVRQRMGGRENAGFGTRLAVALGSGAVGSLLANPFDLIRVRQQSRAMESFSLGTAELVRFLDEQRGRGEGLRSLWKGWQINAARAACFTAGSMMTYEEAKARLSVAGVAEGPVQHLLSGAAMGLVGTFCYMPADNIRTAIYTTQIRFCGQMTSSAAAQSLSAQTMICRHTMLGLVLRMYEKGGFLAFYKGMGGALCRTVPACMIFPSTMEQSRKLWGLSYF